MTGCYILCTGTVLLWVSFLHMHCVPPPRRYSIKVVKAAAQVLNTLWQYRDLRVIYKKVMIHKVIRIHHSSGFMLHLSCITHVTHIHTTIQLYFTVVVIFKYETFFFPPRLFHPTYWTYMCHFSYKYITRSWLWPVNNQDDTFATLPIQTLESFILMRFKFF